MKFLIMKMMFLISIIINFLKNPMSMGLMLLIQTILSIWLMETILNSSWFIMITFLMMVGGLLILIMYMSSIASNEKFKLSFNITFLIIISIMYLEELFMDLMINENLDVLKSNELSISMLQIYNMKSFYISLILVLYLLMTMITVSKVVKFFEGPLRMFSYE